MASFERYMLDEHGQLQKVVINTGVGVGFCLPYYGTEAPPGTLACDGSEISREAYSELFAVLGIKAGAGDGTTTFNLPDLRGLFVRGTGGNAAELGVEQSDAIRDIVGSIEIRGSQGESHSIGSAEGAFSFENLTHTGLQFGLPANGTLIQAIKFAASGSVPTAVENRPVNVALLWCIIYE